MKRSSMGGGGCDGDKTVGFGLGLGAIEIFVVKLPEASGSEIGFAEPSRMIEIGRTNLL